MAPPSRTTSSSFPESYHLTGFQFGGDVHLFDDVINDKMNIDSTTASSTSQYEEKKFDAATSSSSHSTAATSSNSTTRSTNRSTRRPKPPSHKTYKHRRRHLFRPSSFLPQLPHAFAHPSTYRYAPYIPISVTGAVVHSDSPVVPDGCMTAAPSTTRTTTASSMDQDSSKDLEMETECDAESIMGA